MNSPIPSKPLDAQAMDYTRGLSSSAGLVKNSRPEKGSGDLKAACKELESLFIGQLLKEMRATVHKSGLMDGGQGEEIFTSIMDAELSRTIASNGGLGISDQLYAQLSGKIDSPDQEKMQHEKIIKEYVKTADM